MCDPASKGLKCITARPRPVKFLQSCAPVSIAWAGPAHLYMVRGPCAQPQCFSSQRAHHHCGLCAGATGPSGSGGSTPGPPGAPGSPGNGAPGPPGTPAGHRLAIPDSLAFPRTQPLYSVCADLAVKALVGLPTPVSRSVCVSVPGVMKFTLVRCISFQHQGNGKPSTSPPICSKIHQPVSVAVCAACVPPPDLLW